MNYEDIRFPMEKELQKELHELFRGDIIDEIMRLGRVEDPKNKMIKMHEGYLKIIK